MGMSVVKSCHIVLALIFSCIAFLGVGNAIPGCCDALEKECLQASERAQCEEAFNLLCRPSLQTQSSRYNLFSVYAGCCDSTDNCCRKAAGPDIFPAANVNPHPSKYYGKVNWSFMMIDPDRHRNNDPKPQHTSIGSSSIPLFLQIQSIVC